MILYAILIQYQILLMREGFDEEWELQGEEVGALSRNFSSSNGCPLFVLLKDDKEECKSRSADTL